MTPKTNPIDIIVIFIAGIIITLPILWMRKLRVRFAQVFLFDELWS